MSNFHDMNKNEAEAPGEGAPAVAADSGSQGYRSVTLRAVLIGLALLPVNAFWLILMERVRYSAHPTTVSLFFNTVFILVFLVGINSAVARFLGKKWALRQGELLLIYAMVNIGSCMASHDFIQVLIPSLSWPFSQATAANNYQLLLWPHLPRWAMMADSGAAKGFWEGNDSLYTPQHLHAWLLPMVVWTTFVVVLLFVMQCVNVLIRKQWADNERLGFPLTKIPLELTDAQPGGRGQSGVPLIRQKLFLLGFAIAAAMDGTNSLNYYFPAIPALGPGAGQSYWDLAQYFTQQPWKAMGWTPLAFYPFLIGLGMLMPLDFLFSVWFFYIFWKMQSVLVVANAWDSDSRMPYANYQAFGAYMLFCVSTLWVSRRYFVQVARRALGRPSDLDDSDEPMRYRTAFLGIGLGLAALIGFAVTLGLAWWLAILFFVIYLALALAITRMRAELGTPVHDLHFTGPDWTLTDLLGPRAIGAQGLGVFSLFYWFNRAYRSHPMPFQLEAFSMADQTSARRETRRWFWVLLLAGGVGMICAFWAMLHCYYYYGGTAKIYGTFGPEAWDRYSTWLRAPAAPNLRVSGAMIVGFLFAGFLQFMRIRFWWWPFHPLAYAVTGSWEMNLMWFPLFLAWLCKSLLIRFGTVRAYQASLPFFYGLILGQFIPGAILNIWGIITRIPVYQFWQ